MAKRILIIVFLFIIHNVVFGQAWITRKPTKREARLANLHEQCLNSNRYTAKQRRQFFPFNTKLRVELISYESTQKNVQLTYVNGKKDTLSVDSSEIFVPIAVNHFQLIDNHLKERKTLTEAGIDSLTDIMYNIGFTPVKPLVIRPDPGYSCYDPRNAIVFIDGSGRVTQYIEFCFHCKRYFLSLRKIKNTVYCEQKFDLLKKFFLDNGIKYGTVLPKYD